MIVDKTPSQQAKSEGDEAENTGKGIQFNDVNQHDMTQTRKSMMRAVDAKWIADNCAASKRKALSLGAPPSPPYDLPSRSLRSLIESMVIFANIPIHEYSPSGAFLLCRKI